MADNPTTVGSYNRRTDVGATTFRFRVVEEDKRAVLSVAEDEKTSPGRVLMRAAGKMSQDGVSLQLLQKVLLDRRTKRGVFELAHEPYGNYIKDVAGNVRLQDEGDDGLSHYIDHNDFARVLCRYIKLEHEGV